MAEDLVPPDVKVYIDSIDVTTYVMNYTIEIPSFGMRTFAGVIRKDVDTIKTIDMGQIIEIYEDDVREFYGILITKTDDVSGYAIGGSDELWKAIGKPLVKLYDISDPLDPFGGDIRLLAIDLATRAGLVMDDSTVDQTSVIIPQILCDNAKIFQKLEELSQILYWDLYQNPVDRKIYLKNPAEYPVFDTTLEVGVNVVESPAYAENIHQTINEVEIQGVRAFPNTIETFTGDGSKKSYTVTKIPIATYIKIFNETTSTQLIGAVEGSAPSGTYDYLVNLNKGIISFVTAPSNGHVIKIDYTATELTSVSVDSSSSKLITKGTRKLVLVLPDVASIDDATQRAEAILEECSGSFASFTCRTYNLTLSPRYKINFKDILKDKELSNLQIVKVKKSWPEFTTEVTLGKSMLSYNNLISSVEERVKRLERARREGVLLRINKLFTNDMYLALDDFEIKRTLVGVARQFILDDDIYGLLDIDYLGLTYGPARQFVLGDPTNGELGDDYLGQQTPGNTELIVKRRYKWNSYIELSEGTADGNIDITNGDIRFI